MKKKDSWYKRFWLNDKEGSAYMIATVEPMYEWDAQLRKHTGKVTGADVSVELSDCSRSITLEFSFDNDHRGKEWVYSRANRVGKINRMIRILETVRDKMLEVKP